MCSLCDSRIQQSPCDSVPVHLSSDWGHWVYLAALRVSEYLCPDKSCFPAAETNELAAEQRLSVSAGFHFTVLRGWTNNKHSAPVPVPQRPPHPLSPTSVPLRGPADGCMSLTCSNTQDRAVETVLTGDRLGTVWDRLGVNWRNTGHRVETELL